MFKVGDKVEVVVLEKFNQRFVKLGLVGTIEKDDNDPGGYRYFVSFNEGKEWFRKEEIELVSRLSERISISTPTASLDYEAEYYRVQGELVREKAYKDALLEVIVKLMGER